MGVEGWLNNSFCHVIHYFSKICGCSTWGTRSVITYIVTTIIPVIYFFCWKIPYSIIFFSHKGEGGGTLTSDCGPCILSPTTTQMVANRSFCVTLTFAGKDTDSSGYDLKDKNNVTVVAKRIRDSALDYYSTYY